MQQESAVRTPPSPSVAAIPKPLLAASVLAVALVAVSSALLYGLATGPSLERQWAEEINRENGKVCAALGISSESGRSTCAEALSRVRRLQEERLSRDSIL